MNMDKNNVLQKVVDFENVRKGEEENMGEMRYVGTKAWKIRLNVNKENQNTAAVNNRRRKSNVNCISDNSEIFRAVKGFFSDEIPCL